MSAQPFLKPDVLQTEEGYDNQSDSSAKDLSLTNDAKYLQDLQEEQIFNFLVTSECESLPKKHSDLFSHETINLEGTRGILPKLRIEPKFHPQDSFLSLQKWEGCVLQLTENGFIARLVDLTEKNQDEEAEIPMEEISVEDKKLIAPGAIFYWNIGYFDSRSGQRKRESVIRFRRLPAWTAEEIEAARIDAQRIQRTIGWE